MATKQSLKGSNAKVYEIVNVFNKGYNTSVADDVLSENVFRDITNFLPSTEGNITKRPGINRSKMYNLFSSLVSRKYDGLTLNVKGNSNEKGVSSTTLTNLSYLFKNLFQMSSYVYNRSETIGNSKLTTCSFVPENLSNFTVLEDNELLEYFDKFDDLLNYTSSDRLYSNKAYLDFIVIFYGNYTETYNDNGNINTLLSTHAIRIIKVSIKLDKDETGHIINIDYELRQPFRNSKDERLTFRYDGDYIIDFAIYANNYYFMNGYDALVQLSRDINAEGSDDSIIEI